ncbi:MAG TPA: MobF family relaxase [Acidimicrobiales bacterium]|nr:MobF family relaxase [Acidimicrobiales bacterium]
MLRIAPIHTCDAAYYFTGPEVSSSDKWMGRGRSLFGLDGIVRRTDLEALLAGRSPASIPMPIEMPGRSRVVNVGYDVVISAPKSISLLANVATDEVSKSVRAAHEYAVEESIRFLDSQASILRRSINSRISFVQSEGFVGGAFFHEMSRSLDPHLHTHFVMPNFSLGSDGRFSAYNSSFLWSSARAAGSVYQANLRHRVTCELGVQWGPVRNGLAELDLFPKELLRTFSSRSAQIAQSLDELGIEPRTASGKSRMIAALSSRAPKDVSVDLDKLRNTWHAKAARFGFDSSRILDFLGRTPVPTIDDRTRLRAAARIASSNSIPKSHFSLTRRAVQSVCDLMPPGADPVSIYNLANEVTQSPVLRNEITRRREALENIPGDQIGLDRPTESRFTGLVRPRVAQRIQLASVREFGMEF